MLTFVEEALDRDFRENCSHIRRVVDGAASPSGWSRFTWSCPDCGKSETVETPAREDHLVKEA